MGIYLCVCAGGAEDRDSEEFRSLQNPTALLLNELLRTKEAMGREEAEAAAERRRRRRSRSSRRRRTGPLQLASSA
jgi:hypothetical protein